MVTKRLLAAACAVVAMLAPVGCATGSPEPSTPVASPSPTRTPEGGVTLASLGFANGPAYLLVPHGVVLKERVDQPNVVTLVLSAPAGASMVRYLSANVEAMGFTLVASSPDSVVFEDASWNGAFTSVGGLAGLTLRRVG